MTTGMTGPTEKQKVILYASICYTIGLDCLALMNKFRSSVVDHRLLWLCKLSGQFSILNFPL